MMMDYWSCYQLRKKRHELAVFEEAIALFISVVGIDQKSDLLKSEKRYTEWQNDILHRKIGSRYIVQIRNKKICVLVIANEYQVGNNTKNDKKQMTSQR